MKLSLFADDVIINVGNWEELTKILVELVSDDSKISEYTINVKMSINKWNLKIKAQYHCVSILQIKCFRDFSSRDVTLSDIIMVKNCHNKSVQTYRMCNIECELS